MVYGIIAENYTQNNCNIITLQQTHYDINNHLNLIIVQFFNLYFCLGLLGLSGKVRSITPASIASKIICKINSIKGAESERSVLAYNAS